MVMKEIRIFILSQGLLSNEAFSELPIAIFVNKIDCYGACGESEIINAFEIWNDLTGKVRAPDGVVNRFYSVAAIVNSTSFSEIISQCSTPWIL